MKRVLGRSGVELSALGFGCWAIGGEWSDSEGNPRGWGVVDDDESVRAVRRAIELGVTFFDTADIYGTGHSERILGRAIAGRREEIVIASKWGNTFDEASRTRTGTNTSTAYVRQALTASLDRLGTDYLDLYQLHLGNLSDETAADLREKCEDLVRGGLIRGYAWSTDDPDQARLFAEGPHCTAVQHQCNVLEDAPDMLALCVELDLASINRGPLAMGLLTGKYQKGARPERGDIRSTPPEWMKYFTKDGPSPAWVSRIEALREVLTSEGRTLGQGALAWLWARSPRTVPIPGFRTVAQAEENAGALRFGPLRPEQLTEIEGILAGL